MEKNGNLFERFANWATKATGSATAFILAVLIIVVWGITGPIFKFSDVWQLVINTGTTIITFLMVFLIQKSQNKDSKAVHLKLNELIAANKYASNRMVSVEDLSEKELDKLREFYCTLTELAREENDIHSSHSIDAARKNHQSKIETHNEIVSGGAV
jgi:low affinity Fe/Cu permease